jgi:tetratricopeptide (TPR) repeat protein/tRNA A-37 threonylcarbamoyl transferase component Bud32
MNEESLFGAALEMPGSAERRAFLDEACAGDDGLRERVEKLLAADERARGILDRTLCAPPQMEAFRPEPTLAAGQAFAGRFVLRRKLGEGGMGEVWVADQHEPVRRRVAVKVIRHGLGHDRALSRFEAERQALALMSHPNIATVLDAGVEAGRPFFVMELIEGGPLTRHCDEARLTIRERLELFLQVCEAVQHAHTKGVIHRDLKPSNILVELHGDRPVPKVIDFGLAKATGPRLSEQAVSTEVGTLIGTLEYMSPEQAEPNNLDIDTRSDVYSLGVVLYELLAGSVPFSRDRLQSAHFAEMLRIIKEVEPARPSARLSDPGTSSAVAAARRAEPRRLAALVRGELDWIVMRCLEKEPGRRYESASALAMDVRRYLADEPVLAGPPSAGYRLRKYARKHKKALATAGAFAALLVAATVSSVVLASRVVRERNHAREQERSAQASFKRALEAVDQMLTRVGEERLANVPHMEPVRREILKDALRFYQEFLRERGDSPVVRAEAANAYRRVGDIQVLLGSRDEGEVAYRQAVALLEGLLDESPGDPSVLNDLGEVHNSLGLLYHATRRWPQAEATFRLAVASLDPPGREGPLPLKNRDTLARVHNSLLVLYRQTSELDKAESAFFQCRAIADGLLARDPKDAKALTQLARCHQNVGLVYGAKGQVRQAEAAYRKALDLNQQLILREPDEVSHRKRLAQTQNNLGLLYMHARQYDKAEGPFQQSLALNKAIFDAHPKVLAFRMDLAGSYGNMAFYIRRARSAEESLEWTAKAIEIVEPVLRQDPSYLPARVVLFDTLMARAYALDGLGRTKEANDDWRRVLAVSEGQAHINLRLYRPFALVFLGEHARAAAEVEALLAEGHDNGRNLLLFAKVHSLCSAAAGEDSSRPLPEREKLAGRYGTRAVELLRKARDAGHFRDPGEVGHLQESKDLAPIRSRPDFQRLLEELEKKPLPRS